LTWIVRHVEANGCQPSLCEMATHFGVGNTAMKKRLAGLEQLGLVKGIGEPRRRALRLPGLRFRAVVEDEPAPRIAGQPRLTG
jgi:hypothetical protein